MGKYWGMILIAGALGLSACSAPATTDSPSASATGATSPTATPPPSEQSSPSIKIAPLFAAPAATPTASPSLSVEFQDESARAKYLAGVKKANNAWRDGVIPSDEDLLKGAEISCGLFAQGKNYSEIGRLAGSSDIQINNGQAIAVYAARVFCPGYSTSLVK